MSGLCSDADLQSLMGSLQSEDGNDLRRTDRLLAEHPEDPRLHFLRGSLLAGIGRPIEALPALKKAVELAPDFALARFQLGFFQLTSGEAASALETWGPIALLPDPHYLRKFVAGLTHLIRDEFREAVAYLNEGIAANDENGPLNTDMKLIVDQASKLISSSSPVEGEDVEAASATSFLLDQFTGRGRSN